MALIHPYIPNASPVQQSKMLAALGLGNVDELYDAIPLSLRYKIPLKLADAIPSEHDLRRSMEKLLAKNISCDTNLNFLGAGCYQHSIPAVCDEIARRGEFVTAYAGRNYSDHGKYQAMFEFQSLMGDLLNMEVVSTPTYDGGCAASSSLLMTCRLTGRRQILLPTTVAGDRLQQIRGFTSAAADISFYSHDSVTGLIDYQDLQSKISSNTAAVYFETPNYLGIIETQVSQIVECAHESGAMVVAYVDPISLGVLETPAEQGADILVGDIQCLGNHMLAGGGLAGFIATRDDPKIVSEIPTFLVSVVSQKNGEGFGFSLSTLERTSYEKREAASDYYGTTQWLWGITAGVYLSLMGPDGMQQVGDTILQRSHYAAHQLSQVKGLKVPQFSGPFFKEFVVEYPSNFSVAQVNGELLKKGIYGGRELATLFPQHKQSALFCVTEIHTKQDIDLLVQSLQEILI